MDIQYTEAWHSPKNKQVLLFLCKESPKTVLYYGIVQVVNVQMADSNNIIIIVFVDDIYVNSLATGNTNLWCVG